MPFVYGSFSINRNLNGRKLIFTILCAYQKCMKLVYADYFKNSWKLPWVSSLIHYGYKNSSKNDKFLDNYFQLYDGILIPIGWLKRYVTLFSTFFGFSTLPSSNTPSQNYFICRRSVIASITLLQPEH